MCLIDSKSSLQVKEKRSPHGGFCFALLHGVISLDDFLLACRYGRGHLHFRASILLMVIEISVGFN